MKPTTTPQQGTRTRSPLRSFARGLAWVAAGIVGLLLAVYLVLLITPIPLPFARDQVRAMVQQALPPGATIELGEMALALEGGFAPVVQFSPVTYTDAGAGAKIEMEALDVGFSPLRSLIGQPAAVVTIVGPHVQMVQDLFGPRPANFELEPGIDGEPPTVRIIEGANALPSVAISSGGLNVRGTLPAGQSKGLRSDNDWLIYNLEGMEQSLANVVAQGKQGMFSKLSIRDGVMDMHDTVYGLYRQFTAISVELVPEDRDGALTGTFSADLSGRTVDGNFSRVVSDEGKAQLSASVVNLDFSSMLPFMDDPDSPVAVRGAGALSVDVAFDAATGKVEDGLFHIDLTGMDLRLEDDLFPIASSIISVHWTPETAQFVMDEAELRVGQSSTFLGGSFVLGMDDVYGPTVGMAMTARDLKIHPGDMDAPERGFDSLSFSGWSAPLYGALGIDQMLVTKGAGRVVTTGRVDSLRRGVGFDLTVGGENMEADDIKRLWPYFLSPDGRDWFMKTVTGGSVSNAAMRFNFPVGTVARKGEADKPIPPGGLMIDMVGQDVEVAVNEALPSVAIAGRTRLQVRDSRITIAADGSSIDSGAGPIDVSSAALIIDNSVQGRSVLEISGVIDTSVPAMLAMTRQQQPGLLKEETFPIDPEALDGKVNLNVLATLTFNDDNPEMGVDYVLTGSVANFGSSVPIQKHRIGNGQLTFTATQDGYQVGGTAELDGIKAEMHLDGKLDGVPNMLFSATLTADELKSMGFDVSQFITGRARFVGKPLADGTIQMAVDLKEAALNIRDLGLSKAAGTDGTLEAAIRQDGNLTELSQVRLAFGDVSLAGSVSIDAEKGLQKAEFSQLALAPGDNAQLSMTPIEGGYAVRLSGEQLDLKPMLGRFFNLGAGTGGVAATQFNQTIALDIELKRALGFYKTTAFNVDLDMVLRGSDLRRANLQANLGGDRSISVTTNQTPDGKVMSVAFNDLGTILRLLGVYPRVEGGEGSLVMSTNDELRADAGRFQLRNFALIDEANVVQVLGNHQDSRELIARENKLIFRSGEANFIRRKDRIEVTEAILSGDTVGGTIRGFIYTDQRQYDLAGTYVPLFGLNNVFQKLPLFGPLLGGREGEGLIGVTFAIRGGLDNPSFNINPASALLPGAFRSLFEYRAREQPRIE